MTISTIGGYNVRDFEVPDNARSWVIFVVFLESFFAFGLTALMAALVVTKANRASRLRHRIVFSQNMVGNTRGPQSVTLRLCSLHRKPLTDCTIRALYVERPPLNSASSVSRTFELKCHCVEHEYISGEPVPTPLPLLLWNPETISCSLPPHVKINRLPENASIVAIINAIDEMTGVAFQARHIYAISDILIGYSFPTSFKDRDALIPVLETT